jgi:histidinol-phosphate aminotransferase
MIPFLKFSIQDLEAYTVPQEGFPVKLNQNESPFDVPPEIKQEIWDAFQRNPWFRYPSEEPDDLLDALSHYTGHPREGILLGNGSNELIELLFRTFVRDGEKVVYGYPAFVVYRLISQAMVCPPVVALRAVRRS